jgi:hypothetical protein
LIPRFDDGIVVSTTNERFMSIERRLFTGLNEPRRDFESLYAILLEPIQKRLDGSNSAARRAMDCEMSHSRPSPGGDRHPRAVGGASG